MLIQSNAVGDVIVPVKVGSRYSNTCPISGARKFINDIIKNTYNAEHTNERTKSFLQYTVQIPTI